MDEELEKLNKGFEELIKWDKMVAKSLKSKIREAIHIHNDIKEAIIEVEKIVKRWISLYEYTDIERHFKMIDSYINCHLKKRFDKNWTYQFTSCEKQLENIKRKNEIKSRLL